jgi:hypothetical protein
LLFGNLQPNRQALKLRRQNVSYEHSERTSQVFSTLPQTSNLTHFTFFTQNLISLLSTLCLSSFLSIMIIFYLTWLRSIAHHYKGLSEAFLISLLTNRRSFSLTRRAWALWNIPCCSRKSVAFYSLKHYSFNYSFIRGKFVENMAYPHVH